MRKCDSPICKDLIFGQEVVSWSTTSEITENFNGKCTTFNKNVLNYTFQRGMANNTDEGF